MTNEIILIEMTNEIILAEVDDWKIVERRYGQPSKTISYFKLICPCSIFLWWSHWPTANGKCAKHTNDSIPIDILTTMNLLK